MVRVNCQDGDGGGSWVGESRGFHSEKRLPKEVGGQTALEWALSERTSPRQVVALVGGFHSGAALSSGTALFQSAPKERRRRRAEKRSFKRVFLETRFFPLRFAL